MGGELGFAGPAADRGMSLLSAAAWHRSRLCYCSNVHPALHLDEVSALISGTLHAIRNKRSLESMGSGLWLSAAAARRLTAGDGELVRLRALLDKHHIRLFTLNGFPFGNFHRDSVKERVYAPDWSRSGRLEYSLQLAEILAQLLPPDEIEGTISTLPIGYDCDSTAYATALRRLCHAASELHRLEQRSGRRIRLCLEMEPGCMIESSDQLIRLFTRELPTAAAGEGVEPALLQRHLGCCFDVCHQAVMFEDPYRSLQEIAAAGIAIGKMQISSALELTEPEDTAGRQALAEYVEPRYLHQVRAGCGAGEVSGVMDLPLALHRGALPWNCPWRIHFHVPIQADALADGRLRTTRSAIGSALDFLADHRAITPHLEVETYTWQLLPAGLRPQTEEALQQGIVAELTWLEGELRRRSLLREAEAEVG